MSRLTDPKDRLKEAVALRAVEYVQSGMMVELGTGSTAIFATRHIAEMNRTGRCRDIVGFSTSQATLEEATKLGLPMMSGDLPSDLDLTIDGADEVDPQLDSIKGGGGALLREKIVAQVSLREIIVVDDSKTSPRLCTALVVDGGNAKALKELPPNCRLGDNDNAFKGGFRMWVDT